MSERSIRTRLTFTAANHHIFFNFPLMIRKITVTGSTLTADSQVTPLESEEKKLCCEPVALGWSLQVMNLSPSRTFYCKARNVWLKSSMAQWQNLHDFDNMLLCSGFTLQVKNIYTRKPRYTWLKSIVTVDYNVRIVRVAVTCCLKIEFPSGVKNVYVTKVHVRPRSVTQMNSYYLQLSYFLIM